MKITDIYQKYDIMPQLETHMLRVTAVAVYIADKIPAAGEEVVIQTGLLHDMGNIIKFNLDVFPEFVIGKGKQYWEQVKNNLISKYGNDEHAATAGIAKELGVSAEVLDTIINIGFSQSEQVFESKNLERMIVLYADCRVAPFGVCSLQERIADGAKRYKINKPGGKYSQEFFDEMNSFLYKIEDFLAQEGNFLPEDITNESTQYYFENLKNYNLE